MRKGEGQVNVLIGLLIFLVIGVVAVATTITGIANTATSSQSVAYGAITCMNSTSSTLLGYLSPGTFILYNGTTGAAAVITSGNYTLGSQTYGQSTTVTFAITSSGVHGNLNGCRANYTYYDPSYQTNASSRTITALLPIFIALIFVVAIVAYINRGK
jgi:hypothetical protein